MNISSEIEYFELLSLPNHFSERSDMFLRKNIEDDEDDYNNETIVQENAHYEEIENSHEKENSSSCANGNQSMNTRKRKIFAVKRLHRKKYIFKIDKTFTGIILI